MRLIAPGWSIVLALLGVSGLGSACFKDVQFVSRRCPVGDATCQCDAEGGCNSELVCTPENICRSPRCQDGLEGCACPSDGSCDPGLECIDDSCLPPEGVTSGADAGSASDPTTTPQTTSPSTSTSTSTSTSDSDPSMGTGSDDGVSMTSIGPATSTTTTGPDPVTTGLETTGATTGVDPCACGWLDSMSWYDCGFDLPPTAPNNNPPAECPPDVTTFDGQDCSAAGGAITFEGCCDGAFLAFCLEGTIVVSQCTNSGGSCQQTPL